MKFLLRKSDGLSAVGNPSGTSSRMWFENTSSAMACTAPLPWTRLGPELRRCDSALPLSSMGETTNGAPPSYGPPGLFSFDSADEMVAPPGTSKTSSSGGGKKKKKVFRNERQESRKSSGKPPTFGTEAGKPLIPIEGSGQQRIETIVRDFGIVCISREGSNPQKFVYENDVLTRHQRRIDIVTEWISNEISATKVRRAIRRGESIRYIVPDVVREYIFRHGLYRASSVDAFGSGTSCDSALPLSSMGETTNGAPPSYGPPGLFSFDSADEMVAPPGTSKTCSSGGGKKKKKVRRRDTAPSLTDMANLVQEGHEERDECQCRSSETNARSRKSSGKPPTFGTEAGKPLIPIEGSGQQRTDSTSAMVGSSPSPFLSSPFKRQTSSIRSLRKELASEGCADSQLILAKDYLAEAEAHDARKEGGESEAPPSAVSSTDDSKNHLAASAVYWLTKAADNGSEEAVELLSDCFSKRKGIDAQNYATVKACLQRTPQEQLARKAGRMVFQRKSLTKVDTLKNAQDEKPAVLESSYSVVAEVPGAGAQFVALAFNAPIFAGIKTYPPNDLRSSESSFVLINASPQNVSFSITCPSTAGNIRACAVCLFPDDFESLVRALQMALDDLRLLFNLCNSFVRVAKVPTANTDFRIAMLDTGLGTGICINLQSHRLHSSESIFGLVETATEDRSIVLLTPSATGMVNACVVVALGHVVDSGGGSDILHKSVAHYFKVLILRQQAFSTWSPSIHLNLIEVLGLLQRFPLHTQIFGLPNGVQKSLHESMMAGGSPGNPGILSTSLKHPLKPIELHTQHLEPVVHLCDGNDFITSNQLARRLYKCEASPVLGASMPNEPARTSAESSALDDLELLYGGEKLTEQDVVNCSLSYERGLCPSVPSPTAFPVVPPAPSRLLFPRWFLGLILSHPLFRFSPSSQSSFTPFYFSAFLFLLFLFSFLFLSQPIFLASSVVAVVVTVSLLRSSRTLQTFRAWSSLLSSMEPRLDTVTLERKFLSSHRTTRFLLFLFSLALCILSRPPPKSLPWFLPTPECALLSLLLALAVLFSFPSHLEASLCVSFLVLLVLCQFSFFRSSFLLPLNSFLDSLDPLLSSSLVQSLQWDFALEIFLFSVPSLLLFSPSWGLPPLIFVFWISFASYFTSSAKFLPWSSWLRAFLIVSSPFFLRFVPLLLKAFLYLAVLPILAASVTSFLSSPSWEILYWFSLPFVLTMLVLTGILRRKLFPPQSCPPSASKPTCTYLRRVWISLLYFSVLLCFTPFLPFPSHNTSYRLLLLPRGPFADPSFVPIPWEKFYNACRVPRDHASSMTTLQRKNTCSRLHGQNVEGWEGTIVDIADSGPSQDWRGINMFLAKWIPTFVQCAFATEKQSYEDADFCVPPWVLSEESEIVFMVSMPKPSGDTEWGWIGSGEEKLTRTEVRATSFCAKDFSLALLRGDRVSISGVLDLRRDSDTSLPSFANSKYYKGGFDPKMNRREASLILGVSPSASKTRIKIELYKALCKQYAQRVAKQDLTHKLLELQADEN
ncbi:unnamed protein product [Cyprideis torosa]|uniref:Uncharacterized protein n=1 Tax=Cyprideis torosa TaxID=163714 RepID=A0A7R8WCN9_9CRUS|nr:unnamed protein product [Cyprideis torosa]CAG0888601.1 unnamed protein product [Cyprideis torosa]